MDIGIDLGTTYSVMAVAGRVTLAASYPEGIYLEECDVTIIPTPEGDPTFPSAFWVDPQDPETVLVGMEAKQKAEEGETPILFSKRSIGTLEELQTGGRTFTAREVAAYILRYMKGCAERALGEPVRRAVITHPAYFDPNQVEETRKAGEDAGFDMSLPEQMLMEPTAAAMAYTIGDDRDPLRVLTYDLGGGTFDVTYLERRESVIDMRAFDGDHLLGGYNFDPELIYWLRQRLAEAGRPVTLDENDPVDRGRLARLLRLDVGAIFDRFVGASEERMRRALQVAESVAPCILWVDEIEKGFNTGIGGDGGTSSRVLGTFLVWMQEKKAPVFIAATANDVTVLPPELLRPGRFDNRFFVGCPGERSRQEILEIHLRARKLDPAAFDVESIVKFTHGFTGAEIEQAVLDSAYDAFYEGRIATTEDLTRNLQRTRPLVASLGTQMTKTLELLQRGRMELASSDTVPLEELLTLFSGG